MDARARELLGAADLDGTSLVEVVARSLGADPSDVEIVTGIAEIAPYDIESITTAGRYWVYGEALVSGVSRRYRMFVKHMQCWSRTPMFEAIPPELRELARASVPWRSEATVYRSDLAQRLPAGLAMPEAYAVVDIDADSAAVWMEAIPAVHVDWDEKRHAHAARLLGRLAASDEVRPVGQLVAGEGEPTIRRYVQGRVSSQVIPALRDDDLWRHPLVASAFDPRLRRRILDAADRVWMILDELEQVPLGTAHGDACTRNLLVRQGSDDLVLIDYSYWCQAPYGFDLGQLLIGEVQVGERPAADLAALEQVCLAAYVEGLSEEGVELPASLVRRAHALQMLLFTGLSTVPLEHLGEPPSGALLEVAAERAAIARFVLDLVDSTTPI